MDLCQEIKTLKPSDPTTAKYLMAIYNEQGLYNETSSLLEHVMIVNVENEELC